MEEPNIKEKEKPQETILVKKGLFYYIAKIVTFPFWLSTRITIWAWQLFYKGVREMDEVYKNNKKWKTLKTWLSKYEEDEEII